MADEPETPEPEVGEDEASWEEREPAPEPAEEQQTHNPGGDADADDPQKG